MLQTYTWIAPWGMQLCLARLWIPCCFLLKFLLKILCYSYDIYHYSCTSLGSSSYCNCTYRAFWPLNAPFQLIASYPTLFLKFHGHWDCVPRLVANTYKVCLWVQLFHIWSPLLDAILEIEVLWVLPSGVVKILNSTWWSLGHHESHNLGSDLSIWFMDPTIQLI